MTAKAQRRRRKEVVANDDAGGDDVVAAYVAVCEAAGTDTAWLDCIYFVNDPWRDWLLAVQFPSSALDAWIETHIRDVFRAADARRLALDVTTKTKHFAAMWADFRREHVELDDRGKYRRNRYWIWRAATLKQAHERGGCFLHGRGFLFQDGSTPTCAPTSWRKRWPAPAPSGCTIWTVRISEGAAITISGGRVGLRMKTARATR